MCGICGAIDWRGDGARAAEIARRMTGTMIHRGPDDEGALDYAKLSLGMRRLSIIDIAHGRQPIFNEDGTIGVVFNGEIYNFQEIRESLKSLGHNFRTRSDSEVIAHAYEEWGEESVTRLRGMFAIAILDRRGHEGSKQSDEENRVRLFLARDRLGIKPLYYFQNEEAFLFASEVRTLLFSGLVNKELSPAALQSYLLFGSVSEPTTLIEGISSLPPGHRLLIPLNRKPDEIKPEPYWNYPVKEKMNGSANHRSQSAIVQDVRSVLEESVRLHLIADVPIGVFLSGGIDSTSLVALASRESERVHTFTVAFEEAEFNEAEIARRTARKFQTEHQELKLSVEDMLSRLDEALDALDQPSIDGINSYFVSWAARKAGLKVALSGLGGDEVFGGYSTFRWSPRFSSMARVSSRMPAALRSVVSAGIKGAGKKLISQDAAYKLNNVWGDAGALPHPYFFSRTLFTPTQLSSLSKAANADHINSSWMRWLMQETAQVNHLDSFSAVSWLELRSYLVNTLLRDTDSMSMANSLEVRVPFLDHRLVELVSKLPPEMKRRNGVQKFLLVEALKDLIPQEIFRQKKRGFTFPWQRWLKGKLFDRMERGIKKLAPSLQECIKADASQKVWKDFLDGRTNWSRPWSLYVLNRWVEKHLN